MTKSKPEKNQAERRPRPPRPYFRLKRRTPTLNPMTRVLRVQRERPRCNRRGHRRSTLPHQLSTPLLYASAPRAPSIAVDATLPQRACPDSYRYAHDEHLHHRYAVHHSGIVCGRSEMA